MTAFELEILNALRIAGDDVSVAELISRAKIARARANVSSRLCELRTKELCVSTQHDGVNYWSLTPKGWEVLSVDLSPGPDITPDIADPETTPEPVADQPVEADISADNEAQRIADIQSGKTPTYSLSDALNSLGIAMLAAADPVDAGISEDDIPRFDYEPEPDDTVSISPSPVLQEEAQQLRRSIKRFANLDDAIFVLNSLCMMYCDHLPAYQQELGRIARYLREAA